AHAFEVADLVFVLASRGCRAQVSAQMRARTWGTVRFDDGVYGCVGHAVGGTDYAFVDFIAVDLAVVVNLHGAGEHEAVDFGAQAANVGREFERQHGNGAVGEIDAGAAQTGFLIERRVGGYVLGDVGDVDLQFVVAVFELADVDGVVEIARGFSVDGDDGKLTVVAAVTQCAGGNVGCDGLGFCDHFGREAMGQVKLADHDLDVDSEVVFFAENFDDASARILRGAGPVGDFHVDYYALEILPVGVDCGFVAYYTIDRLFAGGDSRRG